MKKGKIDIISNGSKGDRGFTEFSQVGGIKKPANIKCTISKYSWWGGGVWHFLGEGNFPCSLDEPVESLHF